jgi:5'-3' exonuclease
MENELTALMDGDTLAFRIASACQHTIEWPSGLIEPFARRWEGEAALDAYISRLVDRLKVTHLRIFLSCPAEDNWRLRVDENYKSNRKNSVRPLLLGPLKGYLRLKYGAEHLAYLEADDAIGIYATSEDLVPGNKIVVGRDKDFYTIPGLHYQLNNDDSQGDPVIVEVSPMEAIKNHYVQALAGDKVDGYDGCPGIGMKRAREVVENPERLVPKEGVITRGANKGQSVTKWYSAGPCSIWEAVVSQYEKAGLTEADAIRTGRLAKILTANEYDLETKEITLWVPGKE